MPDIIGGPELDLTQVFPFPGCTDPPVLIGSGDLFVENDAGDEIETGNFELAILAGAGEAVRYFAPTEEVQSPLAITTEYRLTLTGDTFAMSQLEKVLNETTVPLVDGEMISLTTVRAAPVRKVRFVKTLHLDPCVLNPTCTELHILLWRAFFDVSFSYSFQRAAITEHVFNLIALPDPVDHPAQPFGYVKKVCPIGVLS